MRLTSGVLRTLAACAFVAGGCSSVGPYSIAIGDVAVLEITLPAGGYEQLMRNTYLNDWVAAVALAEGGRYEGRIRISGQISRHDPKKSYKLVLSEGYDSRSPQHAYVYTAQYRDASFVRHRLASYYFAKAGLRCSRVRPVELVIDDALHGLYLECEPVDSAFLLERGLPIASLYEVNCRARLDAADVLLAEQAFDKQLPDGDRCYDDVATLLRVVTDGITEENLPRIRGILDIGNALSFYAAVLVTDNGDGVRNNYYLYLNPSTAVFEFIPWDLDQTFKFLYDSLPVYENGLFEQLMAIPSCRADVEQRVRELFDLDEGLCLVDSLAAEVQASYTRDPYLSAARMQQDTAVAHVRRYLQNLAAVIEDL